MRLHAKSDALQVAIVLVQNNLYKLFLVNGIKYLSPDILGQAVSYGSSQSQYGGTLHSSTVVSTTITEYSWLELWCHNLVQFYFCMLFPVKWQRGFQILRRIKYSHFTLQFQGFLLLVFFWLSFPLASSWVCQSWCPFGWLASLLIWWCQWKSGDSFTAWWCTLWGLIVQIQTSSSAPWMCLSKSLLWTGRWDFVVFHFSSVKILKL